MAIFFAVVISYLKMCLKGLELRIDSAVLGEGQDKPLSLVSAWDTTVDLNFLFLIHHSVQNPFCYPKI